MKRVTITADCMIPGNNPEAASRPLFAGSTLDLDDNIAGLLVVSGKARHDADGKVKDVTKDRMSAIDQRAEEAAKPAAAVATETLAAAIAQALQLMQPKAA